MKGRWVLLEDGWVPLDWKRRVATAMICSGMLGFVAGSLFFHWANQ